MSERTGERHASACRYESEIPEGSRRSARRIHFGQCRAEPMCRASERRGRMDLSQSRSPSMLPLQHEPAQECSPSQPQPRPALPEGFRVRALSVHERRDVVFVQSYCASSLSDGDTNSVYGHECPSYIRSFWHRSENLTHLQHVSESKPR